jgi:hypothetical protein
MGRMEKLDKGPFFIPFPVGIVRRYIVEIAKKRFPAET